ncbi:MULTISPECIES: hypothetical protein [Bacillaceae]|uniref:hypothetical protein n=1 Tax=Bacillaceae TaxID=186817 RepID=UPI00296426DA|nr:hypothetical protein [Bacillus infantis]MDW2879557.1 hypothetical protein [Bacillus infantis]
MHKSNKTKTGLEEVLINIQNNTAGTIALYLKGFEVDEIAKKLSINIKEVKDIIKKFEEDQ